MIIKKVLNNNVIITENQEGREVVAMGCGIAFKKKVGDDVSDDSIDKFYTLSNHDMLENFKALLADISADYLEVSNEIIEIAEKELGRKLNESIYIALTDHLHMAVQRYKDGIQIRNMMLWEIRRYYAAEFSIGQKALAILKKRFSLELPEDEAGFIALHIIDGQMDKEQPMANDIMHMIQELTNIVRYTGNIEYDKDSLQYYRFVTHLKFFAKRVLTGQESTAEVDAEMSAMVQKKYAAAYRCVLKIAEFVESNYHYKVNEDEKFYLMIHSAKVMRP